MTKATNSFEIARNKFKKIRFLVLFESQSIGGQDPLLSLRGIYLEVPNSSSDRMPKTLSSNDKMLELRVRGNRLNARQLLLHLDSRMFWASIKVKTLRDQKVQENSRNLNKAHYYFLKEVS